MPNCGIRNGGMCNELAHKLSSVGIKGLNHHTIIKYILYFKTVSLKKHVSNVTIVD